MQLYDQLHRTITLAQPAQRIVSLVPSLTELLHYLGLGERVVGITRFCVHPEEWFRTKARIGGTKNVHPDRVQALQPDLIIASREENVRGQVEALESMAPVFVTDVTDLASALDMIQGIGQLTGTGTAATMLTRQIEAGFNALAAPPGLQRVAYFIWRDPWMVAGGDTFIDAMLQQAGYRNVFAHLDRYPAVDLQSLPESGCQCIFLSSEPYPFKEKHVEELRAALPGIPVHLVDGELFSWYGSRLLHAPAYFQQLRLETAPARPPGQ